jgi:ferredoxin--NADP+ reductase
LFAARQIASEGVQVVLLTAISSPVAWQYGIYPSKHKMKEGLRKQFRQILETPNIDYYGNLVVGQKGDLSLTDLRAMGFQALLVTVGAQGTKWLGIPGEDLVGVYHAKDIVYHYNQLLPSANRNLPSGSK